MTRYLDPVSYESHADTQRRLRKAMALKEEIGLTSDERHELASFLFSYREGEEGSWKNLTSRELHDLICFLEGYLFISQLLEQRT